MSGTVLLVGPECETSSGGMASVIRTLRDSPTLRSEWNIKVFPSCCDGPLVKRLSYTAVQLLRFVVGAQADVCHIHIASYSSTWRKLLYGRIAGAKGMNVIYHIHGAEYREFVSSLSPSKRRYVVDALSAAERVVALSNSWKSYFQEELGLNNVSVIYNSIDVDSFGYAIGEEGHVAFVGRIGSRKGTYDLLEALAIIKRRGSFFHCVLAGDGEVDKAEKIAGSLGVSGNVDFVGWVSVRDVRRIMMESSILVLPSYNEGFPMSIIEAMSCGNAIVSTDAGGIPEAVCGEGSILVSPGDIDGLANALQKLLEDRNLSMKMAEKNRQYVERELDNKVVHKQLSCVYTETMNGYAE